MKVWGMNENDLFVVARELEIEFENIRFSSKTAEFRAKPKSSKGKYARRSASGRRMKALCYHGFRDLITRLFERGAIRVKTAEGDWGSRAEFTDDLNGLAHLNKGSRIEPVYMIDLCECGKDV